MYIGVKTLERALMSFSISIDVHTLFCIEFLKTNKNIETNLKNKKHNGKCDHPT